MKSIIEESSYLSFLVGLVLTFIFGAITCTWATIIKKYIREKYPELWEDLSSGFQRKLVKFLNTNEEINDPYIKYWRLKYQRYSKLCKLSMLITFAGLALIRLLGLDKP